ncbi:thiamine phosphate synthase [Priestia koreensis]|uniref:thiamine phosphate synthase n=1 Tax=Priestia koreensis TaxID=284581 RepID=UPI001F5A1A94|nr:thiamine phosphate synthase [Priestia koreensis]UNL85191.1 thiamine phosphate synthase [Priestia koreensis]
MVYAGEKEVRELLGVYFIMGSTNCLKNPLEVLEDAIKGGITLFQFREKGAEALKGNEKKELARSLQEICRKYHIPFIVNDDIELAIELDADGVHIGQDDESASAVRRRLGSNKLIGVSAHNVAQAKQAIIDGADYIGVGPIYPTATKLDTEPVQGSTVIESILEENIQIPIVGIGGITETNAGDVIRFGADGVSVITAISHAPFPEKAAKKLASAVKIVH